VSGIAGILNIDGAPADGKLLSGMTHFLAFRGPDAQRTQCAGPIGLGHALLRTTNDSASDEQPTSLDGNVWITADARIDARLNLIEELRTHGREVSTSTSDAQLILHAYHAWGSACVDHLLGDFVFAIWDGPARKFFCARDQFGIKCFYYAHAGNFLVFSNTLDCVRLHPGVSDRLNDLSIADFLLFESSQEPGATAFSDIARLEPAHTLELKDGKISVRRYWTLPVSAPFPYKRPIECVERFRELMGTAVADRVRTGPAGVLMSGGLDSSIVAASAHRVLKPTERGTNLRAYTEVYDHLIPHNERHYARLVAEALQIPIEILVADNYRVFQEADPAQRQWPEPGHWAWEAPRMDMLRRLASNNRIALTGYGGDPVLACRLSVYFRQLLMKGELRRGLTDAYRYLTSEKRLSRLYLRSRWRILFGRRGIESQFPNWVNPELEQRYRLRQRWDELNDIMPPGQGVRPVAYSSITSTMWPWIFESLDAGITRIPVEVSHPFFDLRLVNYLLSLPALPWCSDKELLREAIRGVLPDAVRLRRKTTLPVDPLVACLRRPESAWVDKFEPAPGLERYVVRDRIQPVFNGTDSWAAWINLRPLSLNFWLQRTAPTYKQF
jgi:asparagine synthase (glutamine-hydrolysing)